MTAAEDAYREAERLIAEAKRDDATEPSLDRPETHALTTLPPSIADLDRVTTLNLANTHITDLSPLAGMTGITWPSLANTMVTNLAPLAGITGITDLRLSNAQIIDLSPLAGMTGITALLLDNTPVTDLSPLAGMTGIRTFFLGNTQITDLSPLAGMTGITWLSLENTRITDLNPLAGMTRITILTLSNTQITDLSQLASMNAIAVLSIENTQVADLSPLAGLTGMTGLMLDNTHVMDLRVLRGMRKLVESRSADGLTFKGCAAARADARIAEIAEIEDDKERARALFDYLEDWVPPGADQAAMIPAQVPAPIEAEVTTEGVLVERPVPPGLTGDREVRARAGWVALRELQADAVETLCRDNLPNLTRAIRAFGRALGDDYAAMNVIALGTHGLRIVEMSKTIDDALLEDAAGDLVAYAAAIQLHLQRFPDWVAYPADTEAAAPEGPPLAATLPQLRVVVRVLAEADDVDPALARKFGDLIEGAEDAVAVDAPARQGVLRSLSNILAPLARRVLAAPRRLGSDLAGEAYKAAIKGTVLSSAGVGWDLIFNKGQVLLVLAQSYPATLGWLTAVLRALGIV